MPKKIKRLTKKDYDFLKKLCQEIAMRKFREKNIQQVITKKIIYVQKYPQLKDQSKINSYQHMNAKLQEQSFQHQQQQIKKNDVYVEKNKLLQKQSTAKQIPEEKIKIEEIVNQKDRKEEQKREYDQIKRDSQQRIDRIKWVEKSSSNTIIKNRKIYRQRFADTQNKQEQENLQNQNFQQLDAKCQQKSQQIEQMIQNIQTIQFIQTIQTIQTQSKELQSQKQSNNQKIQLFEDQNEDILDDQYQEQYNMDFNEDLLQFGMDNFVLDNLLYIKKPKRHIKIHNVFKDIKDYQYSLNELFKYQVLSHMKSALQKIEDDKGKVIKIKISLLQKQDKVYVYPIDFDESFKQNYYLLNEVLMSGPTIGVITNSQDFSIDLLDNGLAKLCCLSRFKGKIQVRGLQDITQIPMYFINIDSLTSYKRQYMAISNLNQTKYINQIIGKGKNNNIINKNRRKYLQTKDIIEDIRQIRNQSQFNAIRQIFLAQEGFFIKQGPPGTGKTSCISNLVSLEYNYFRDTRSREKILICSESNAAINHLCTIILDKGLIGTSREPKLLRLGKISHSNQHLLQVSLSHLAQTRLIKKHFHGQNLLTPTQLKIESQFLSERLKKLKYENKREQLKKTKKSYKKIMEQFDFIGKFLNDNFTQFQQIELQLLMDAQIIMSTLNTCGKKLYINSIDNVGCLIIDQAGQATQPSILIPFKTQPRKVVLVGDHKQLNPTVASPNAEHTKYSRSLFQRLIQNNFKYFLLDTQYRMIPQLSQYFNNKFYGGQLKNGVIKQYPVGSTKLLKSRIFYDISYGKEKLFKKSYINEAQAQGIIYLIQRLIKEDKNLTIGLIAHYKSQVKQLEQRLQDLDLPQQIIENIKISTVDSFQGQQRDIIIISNVRANNNNNIGFVKDEKRMNVALSRCKFGLFVFGNRLTFQTNHLWKHYINDNHKKDSLITIKSANLLKQKISQNFKRSL